MGAPHRGQTSLAWVQVAQPRSVAWVQVAPLCLRIMCCCLRRWRLEVVERPRGARQGRGFGKGFAEIPNLSDAGQVPRGPTATNPGHCLDETRSQRLTDFAPTRRWSERNQRKRPNQRPLAPSWLVSGPNLAQAPTWGVSYNPLSQRDNEAPRWGSQRGDVAFSGVSRGGMVEAPGIEPGLPPASQQ